MIRPLVSGVAMALLSIAIVLVIFTSIHLVLFSCAGLVAVPYFQARDPNWDAGPLGGIQVLPIFVLLLPLSVWLTSLAWKRIRQWLSMKCEFFRTGQRVLSVPLLVLTVGILGVGIPFVKGLVSGYLYSSGNGG
jgi:hypothetical protein